MRVCLLIYIYIWVGNNVMRVCLLIYICMGR